MRQFFTLILLCAVSTVYAQPTSILNDSLLYELQFVQGTWKTDTDPGGNAEDPVIKINVAPTDSNDPFDLNVLADESAFCTFWQAQAPAPGPVLNQVVSSGCIYQHINMHYAYYEDDGPGGENCTYTAVNDSLGQDSVVIAISDALVSGWEQESFFSTHFDFSIRYAKRYKAGTADHPLDFGMISPLPAYGMDINSNLAKPLGALADLDYTNDRGNVSRDVYYTFQIDTKQKVSISTDYPTTDFDTYLELYGDSTYTSLISRNDDFNAGKSKIEVNLSPGKYYVRVEGHGNAEGLFEVRISTEAPTNITCPASGAPIFVNVHSDTDLQNGLSWHTPHIDLQAAINQACACPNSEEIRVSYGDYKPSMRYNSLPSNKLTVRHATFHITDPVHIIGGYTGRGDTRVTGVQRTFLNGNIGTGTGHSFHVVTAQAPQGSPFGSDIILEDLSIINGSANDTDPFDGQRSGAGIFSIGPVDLVIKRCSFENNYAVRDGGAILTGSSFGSDNNLTIDQCQFLDNESDRFGGAIAAFGYFLSSNPSSIEVTVTNSTFIQNTATSDGGAIYLDGAENSLPYTLTNNVYSSNTAGNGGAIATLNKAGGDITNCSFSNNKATVSTTGHTIDNRGDNDGTTLTLKNSILYGTGMELNDDTGSAVVMNCLIQGGFPGSTCVLTSDPIFVDPTNHNLRLTPLSPAIDTGDNNAITLTTDIDGYPRINGKVDLGAYENYCPKTQGSILYVDQDATSGDHLGNSWTDAYLTIQQAVSQACNCVINGQKPEIWVTSGRYRPRGYLFDGDASGTILIDDATIYIDDNVQLYGGFTSGATKRTQRSLDDRTIIDGALDEIDGVSDTAIHLMVIEDTDRPIDSTCVIDGFSFVNGKTDQSGTAIGIRASGGGILVQANSIASPTIINCDFSNNVARFGGAIAMNCPTGIRSNPQIINCKFFENNAFQGGALHLRAINNAQCSPIIVNSTFSNNVADFEGGAIFTNVGPGTTPSDPQIYNCSFGHNSAPTAGAISNDATDAEFRIFNSIFWENDDPFGDVSFARYEIRHTIIQGGFAGGANTTTENILDQDPLYAFANANNLKLSSGSPAIDAGVDSLARSVVDIDQAARIKQTAIDLGAHEFGNPCSVVQKFLAPNDFLSGQKYEFVTDMPGSLVMNNRVLEVAEVSILANAAVGLNAGFEVKDTGVLTIDEGGCN